MVEGKGLGIGIGLGIVIGIGIGLFAGSSMDFTKSTQINPIDIILPETEPYLAQIQTTYSHENDRLVVVLLLTDKEGEHTKADGRIGLTMYSDLGIVRGYSAEYDFTKDDFSSWKNNAGGKDTGYRIDILRVFSGGSFDVYGTVSLQSGAVWDNLHDSFYSLN